MFSVTGPGGPRFQLGTTRWEEGWEVTLEVSEILGEPRDLVHTPNSSKSLLEVWTGRRGPHFLGSILLRFLPADPLTSTNRALGGHKLADRLGLHGRFAPHRLSASLGWRGCKAEISLCLIPTWGQYEPKQWRAPKATASRCQQTLCSIPILRAVAVGVGIRMVVPEGRLQHPHQSANALLLGPPRGFAVPEMEAVRLRPALSMRLTQKGPPLHFEVAF